MNIVNAALLLAFFGVFPVPHLRGSQQAAPRATPQQSESAPQGASAARALDISPVDPAKVTLIRALLEVTGTKKMVAQTMDAMEENIKPLLTSSLPKGEYRDKLVALFFVRFHSKMRADDILDLAIASYAQHFSDDELRGLIQFYNTPIGQKVASVVPAIVAEMQEKGKALGSQAGLESMREVLAENPDLAEALEVAAKPQQPKP